MKERNNSVTNGAMFQTMYAKRYLDDITKLRSHHVKLHSNSHLEGYSVLEQPARKIKRRTYLGHKNGLKNRIQHQLLEYKNNQRK